MSYIRVYEDPRLTPPDDDITCDYEDPISPMDEILTASGCPGQ